MSTESASSLGRGLVDLDVLDDELLSVETGNDGVGLSVLEKVDEVASGLHGPASLGNTELLACLVRTGEPR